MLLITKRINNGDICSQISFSDNVIALKEAITIEIYVKYYENGIKQNDVLRERKLHLR